MELKQPDDPEDNDRYLSKVEKHFETAVEMFQDMTTRVDDGETVTDAEAAKAGRRLFDAAQVLITLKNRIYDERKRQEGVANAYALDLDDARDTVGRLLDRLRAAGDTGDLSE